LRLSFALAVLGFAAAVGVSTAAALAGELRDFCPNRPGLGTPSCIIDKGHAVRLLHTVRGVGYVLREGNRP